MTLATLLVLVSKPAHVGSGAVLTLVLPLGITIIALSVWWYLARRSTRRE